MSNYTEEQLRAIEQQLRCPSGDMGVELGQRMNEFNKAMVLHTIEALELQKGEIVLELGHGNGGHLSHLLQQATQLVYYGLDISSTMHEQAKVMNQQLMQQQSLHFQLYNGLELPFEDNFFDKIMTVNTIYFWEDHSQLMQEIGRVLKPQGTAIITFAHKSYLENSPTVGNLFTLVSKEEVQQWGALAGLTTVKFVDLHDQIENSAQEWVRRDFSLAILAKN